MASSSIKFEPSAPTRLARESHLLQRILEHVALQPPWYNRPSFWLESDWRKKQSSINRKTLARVARANKALSKPALAMLWRNLDSLEPLLSVLPSCGRINRNHVGPLSIVVF